MFNFFNTKKQNEEVEDWIKEANDNEGGFFTKREQKNLLSSHKKDLEELNKKKLPYGKKTRKY